MANRQTTKLVTKRDNTDSYEKNVLLLIHSLCDLSNALFADSSLRVKDVIKEFHPGGRLAQHSFGEVSFLDNDTFANLLMSSHFF